MDPWAAAINHWALPDTGPCYGQAVFDSKKTAMACQRELEILGHHRQRTQQCPITDHYHLHRDPHDLPTAQEGRARRLLRILHNTKSGLVERASVRDSIEWGGTSWLRRRKHFNWMLSVLKRYELISLDDTHIRIVDPDGIGDLVNRSGSGVR